MIQTTPTQSKTCPAELTYNYTTQEWGTSARHFTVGSECFKVIDLPVTGVRVFKEASRYSDDWLRIASDTRLGRMMIAKADEVVRTLAEGDK